MATRKQPLDRLSVDAYFDVLASWLDLESAAERERMASRRQMRNTSDAERTGETILGLQLQDHQTGLAGRFLFDFAKFGNKPLPMNRLKVGSPVVISDADDPSDKGIAGVVSRRKPNVIQVATEKWPDARFFRLDLSPDETTRRRQLAAMATARMAHGRSRQLRDMLLDQRPIRPGDPEDVDFCSNLNPPQQDAVRFALAAPDIAILHGPPGTGKTTTLAEVIYQGVQRGDRVLACAPSNTAVDNLLERLVGMLSSVLRVGHPARVFESLRGHTLDELVEADPSNAVIRDMRRELEELMRAAGRANRGRDTKKRRSLLYATAGDLRSQIRSLERSIVRGIIDSSDVICTTTTIDEDLLGDATFDLVVIDEACQCTESSVWQAVMRADMVVMAGDHCQLPPTVLSDQAAAEGMRDSMMHRLIEREGESIYRRLTVQYRMNEPIMQFSSQEFYDDSLIADASVATHRLCDLPDVQQSPLTEDALLFVDTAGSGMHEELEPGGESKLNSGEGKLIVRFVTELLEAGVQRDQIAIIAPYAAQARWLRNQTGLRDVEIDTVDGFQGREKEVVLITLTRSNDHGEIGFLADTRRTNVALTRARRKLIVVGDSSTLGGNEFYARMLEYFESENAYRSVFEFADV
ncbi:AAA domain-containing protein [Stieleria sp. TO1_6]|uniref:AAA domain-containing protein n=1 Tax=Stieleria tagensis TaxID=2956795 RepID=UPI00209AE1C4|nr:AAA domain-containing protein [Stieleria tagensis]MCO8122832.1 AAA domain-containing protein [Stieleria tagensis]